MSASDSSAHIRTSAVLHMYTFQKMLRYDMKDIVSPDGVIFDSMQGQCTERMPARAHTSQECNRMVGCIDSKTVHEGRFNKMGRFNEGNDGCRQGATETSAVPLSHMHAAA